MYVVNALGRVLEMDESEARDRLDSKIFREASDDEISSYTAERRLMNRRAAVVDTVYFQTVKASPDGYGMSKDHLTKELAMLDVFLSENYGDQKVGVLYNYPYGVISMRSDVRIIYTMFESDKIPNEWADYLDMADQVLVPSKWCQDVFKKAGIQSTVVPLGYNDRVFNYVEREIPKKIDKPFTFIHYDSFNLRKGFSEVFKAFTEEFGAKDNVRLILKTAQNNVAIPIMESEYPNIDVVMGTVSEFELLDLLSKSNCMVYPSRGEGFGITPLEAMATGLPAIVPNAHGISEYFNPNYMLEVKVGSKCPGLYSRFKGQDVGEMIVCDVQDLRRQMRYAYENQETMHQLGKSAAEYSKQYTYRSTAEHLAEIINKWIETENIKRRDSKYLRVEKI